MEVRCIRLISILLFYGAIAHAGMTQAMPSEGVADLKTLFHNKIRGVEESFAAFQNEMMQENAMLRKSVDELNTKLDKERLERADAIKQLERQFSEKETELKLEIEDLKSQLMSERDGRNREPELLSAKTAESLPIPQRGLNAPKEDDNTISRGSLPEKGKRVKQTRKHDMHAKNKVTSAGNRLCFII